MPKHFSSHARLKPTVFHPFAEILLSVQMLCSCLESHLAPALMIKCMSSGAPVIIGQAESEPLGKFMTAAGRAVSVDTAYLRKIQALFDSCETESSKVSCGRDDSVGTAPPTSFVDNDVSDADDPNAQHDTFAVLCPAGGEPVGKVHDSWRTSSFSGCSTRKQSAAFVSVVRG